MSLNRFRWVRAAGLALVMGSFAPWASALTFAVNEGVSYNVPNEEIRAKYAAITACPSC
jgi:phosphonate transport system substrate-binding protein